MTIHVSIIIIEEDGLNSIDSALFIITIIIAETTGKEAVINTVIMSFDLLDWN